MRGLRGMIRQSPRCRTRQRNITMLRTDTFTLWRARANQQSQARNKTCAMKRITEATIQWIKAEEGGRQLPPPGPKYSTVARFEIQKEIWPREAWSLVVEFIEPPNAAL